MACSCRPWPKSRDMAKLQQQNLAIYSKTRKLSKCIEENDVKKTNSTNAENNQWRVRHIY